MPYSDYWIIFGGLVRADGSVDLGDLLVRHNDHPLLVAKSLYALNLQLFDGSNATLALAVLLVGILQLVAVGVLLARSRLSFAERSLVLILSSVLLFSMNGAWNYVLAMSGAAWLTANVLVLAAIVLRQHDRTWGAFALGVLATASYGTGMAVWPALVVIGIVRRPWRDWWKELAPVAGFVVANWVRTSQSNLTIEIPFDPGQLLRDVATLLGFGVGIDGSAGRLVGYVALAVAVPLVAWAVARRVEAAAPWAGLTTYGVASCAFIVYGRPNFLGGEPNRYQSLAALFWVGLVALLVHGYRGAVLGFTADRAPAVRRVTLAAASAVVVLPLLIPSWAAGSAHRRALEDGRTLQDLGAVALRLGVDDDLEFMLRFGRSPASVEELRAAGQYPFSPRWDADCGLLGQRIPVDDLPSADGGLATATRPAQLEGGIDLAGRVPVALDPACILILGDHQEVVGAGVLDLWANGFRTSDANPLVFRAVARDGHRSYQAVVVTGAGQRVLLVDGLDGAEITDPA